MHQDASDGENTSQGSTKIHFISEDEHARDNDEDSLECVSDGMRHGRLSKHKKANSL
jgi:hypothetical protein